MKLTIQAITTFSSQTRGECLQEKFNVISTKQNNIKSTNATALHNRGASAAAFTVMLKEKHRLGKTRGNDRFLYRNIQVRPNEHEDDKQ